MFGEAEGADATLFSGKISLEGLANPVLMFYTYNIEGDDGDLNEIEVAVNGGDGFKVEKNVMTWTLGEDDGWYLVVVPLDKYKGKVIQFSLRGITYTRKFTLIDNIVVTSLDNHDLRVTAINAPPQLRPIRSSLLRSMLRIYRSTKLTILTSSFSVMAGMWAQGTGSPGCRRHTGCQIPPGVYGS